jgi:hypothetical protein
VLSPNLVIDGNGQEYTPHVGNMLFFTVEVNGDGSTCKGPRTSSRT